MYSASESMRRSIWSIDGEPAAPSSPLGSRSASGYTVNRRRGMASALAPSSAHLNHLPFCEKGETTMSTYAADASASQHDTPRQDGAQLATFAGGCFWCMVKPFDQWDGVHAVLSGYTGGHVPHPTYEQVKSQKTGHLEAVQIIFDPAIIPYSQLLELYWAQIDPTDEGGQFQDRGESYTTAIFVHNEEQRRLAEASRAEPGGERTVRPACRHAHSRCRPLLSSRGLPSGLLPQRA